MKRQLVALFVTMGALLMPTVGSGQQAPDSRAALAKLKTLVGQWESTQKGRTSPPQTVVYSLTGGGSVLVEMAGGMMTTYHMDKDHLVLTHFCGAGNQPRMRIKAADERHIAFEMYDITNLADPKAPHSTSLDIRFLGPDRIDLAFGGREEGKATSQVFQLTRKGGSRP